MKQRFTKLLAAFALLVFMMPSMVGWGQTRTETTYEFNKKNWETTTSNWTSKKDGNAFTSGQGIQVTTGASGACGNSDASYSNVSKITVTYCTNSSKGAGKISWYNVSSTNAAAQSGTLVGEQSISAPSSNGTTLRTFDIVPSESQTGFIQLYVTCTTNSIYVFSVKITYTSTIIPTTLAIDDLGITNTDIYTSTVAGSLAATVTPESGSALENPAIIWSSDDESVATIAANGAVTLVAAGTTIITASYEGDATYGPSSNTYELEVTDSKPATSVTIDDTGITNTNVYVGTAAGFLSATVKDDDDVAIEGATVNWTSSNTSVATIANDGTVALVAAGITTITASYAGDDNHKPSSATCQLAVTNVNPNLATIWSEDFSEYSSGDVPSGGTYNYVCTNGSGTTKIYNEASTGGTAPELLVGKSNGTFSATITLLTSTQCFSGDLTLTYKTNAKSLNVKTTTDGITVEGEASAGAGLTFSSLGVHTITFKGVTTSTENITIVFTATSGDNVRLDDIMLVGEQVAVTTVATPVFSPAGGIVISGTEVTITCATENASIKYSYDNETWNDYFSALTITENKTIYAKAVKEGLLDSEVASAEYTIAEPCAIPTFSPEAGEVEKGTTVTISTTTEGATIYYTTNGSTPTTSSTAYSAPITINSDMTIKAIAVKEGYVDSEVSSADYTVRNYAVLTFDWSGGSKDALLALSGVTAYGLGSGYSSHSPYNIQFDGTGDYIQVKTDSRPGKVLIGVKMIGGSTTSTITVKGSADGNNFTDVEVLTISGSQNTILNLATTNAFAATDRYVRLYFTKGSNVGVGPIMITRCTKEITGHGGNAGNWYLIASPLTQNPAPTGINGLVASDGHYDLYRFNQSPIANNEGQYMEWENYKTHTNGFVLENGKGYLYASKENTTLYFAGAYNADDAKTVDLVYETTNPDTKMHGWNLVGNPFVTVAYADRSYFVMDEDGTIVVPQEVSSATAINPFTGVFVHAAATGEFVTFSKTAPSNTNDKGVINLALSQQVNRGSAMVDKAVVSFNEGDQLDKFVFMESTAKLYIPQNGKEYAIAVADAQGEMPVNFKAEENGTYTLNIDTKNVEMNYLHLIDNMTGMDVDLLQTPSYTFDATTNDYTSRFRLVFAAGASTGSETSEDFAFFSNGSWVVNNEGEATLQVVDVNGRIVSNEAINGCVNKTITATPGIYMLRLINGNEVKTQKIVVK